MPSTSGPLVVALLYDGLCTFEFGIVAEVFGLARPEMGEGWYRFASCAIEDGPLRAQGGLLVTPEHGIDLLDQADIIVNNGRANFEIPREQNEGSFSSRLTKSDGDAIVFFEQDYLNKGCAVFFPKLSWLSGLMIESCKYEYFVTNMTADFLISVNWYVIAGIGDADLV